jgi:hypothetical protein
MMPVKPLHPTPVRVMQAAAMRPPETRVAIQVHLTPTGIELQTIVTTASRSQTSINSIRIEMVGAMRAAMAQMAMATESLI